MSFFSITYKDTAINQDITMYTTDTGGIISRKRKGNSLHMKTMNSVTEMDRFSYSSVNIQ